MNQKPQPPQIPMVPMNAHTLRANIAFVQLGLANGSITLGAFDQREAPVERVGDPVILANYEVGRFELTPRALRGLLDSANVAAAAFKQLTGRELPTMAEFDAMPSINSLQQMLSNQPPPGDVK